jgi:hypothetical protein
MGLMMWLMMRGAKQPTTPDPTTQDASAELARLRAEIDQLQAAQRDSEATAGDTRPTR